MSFTTTTTSNSSNNNYSSVQLDLYRQTGDICIFLDYRFGRSADKNNLTGKFDAFDAAGFHLPSSNSILELIVPSILRQFAVSRCIYEAWLSLLNSTTFEEEDVDERMDCIPKLKKLILKKMPYIIVPASVSLLSVLFNISLLIVTARKISMSTVSNWLIAFDSFCQIPALLPLLVNLFALCAHLDSVDSSVCLTSLMLSTGFSYASFLAVYFMSLERLLIVLMPMRMSQMSEKTIVKCSLLAVLACMCFGVAMILIIFNIYEEIYAPFGSLLYCTYSFYTIVLSVHGISHTILGLALLNYVLIAGLIVWRRIYVPSTQADSNNNAAYSQATHRMLRSVFLITLVFLIGWLIGSVLLFKIIGPFIGKLTARIGLALITDFSEAVRFSHNLYIWVLGLAFCLFPVAAGINAPVLIINNSDYREAYKKTLAPILICRKRTAVGPLFINHHHHQITVLNA